MLRLWRPHLLLLLLLAAALAAWHLLRGKEQQQQQQQQQQQRYRQPNRTNILLLSSARSGSSFLGTVLSSPERGAFVFEPLIALDKHAELGSSGSNEEIVRGIFRCNKVGSFVINREFS